MNIILLLTVLLPIVGAAVILAGAPARLVARYVAGGTLALSVLLFLAYDRETAGFQFLFSIPILAALDLKFFLGVDGLSITLLLLSGIVTVAAIWMVNDKVKSPNAFYACLLFISGGSIGAFASLDLFFFYAFHELALIPTFLLIGIWGSGERRAAAWKITIYLGVGSIILLVGLLSLYLSLPAGAQTFDMKVMLEMREAGLLEPANQGVTYLLLLIGFGILISLFPFHTWAPQAYACAPVPAAMLHAGILKKFGLYGLIRLAVPMVPEGAEMYVNLLLLLLLGNILYVGMVTIAQKRLDTMLGYSSVMHMGYAFLGIASLNEIGLSGAALLLFAHGLSIALLFALAGWIQQRCGTLEFSKLGGMAKTMPFLAVVFGMAAFASIGLPGFANFPSEMLVFFGAFANNFSEAGFSNYQWATLLAVWGVVISAIYMLRAYRAIFFGEEVGVKSDSASGQVTRWPLLLLLAALLVVGCYPNLLLDLIAPNLHPFFALK